MVLPKHHGFTYAVKAALPEVKTNYVMVIQHDRDFCREFSLEKVINAMEVDTDIKMVSLMSTTTINHAMKQFNKELIKKETLKWALTPKYDEPGCKLIPLLFWYDSTHIASVKYYNEFVFHPKRFLKHGGFIEDELGQQ